MHKRQHEAPVNPDVKLLAKNKMSKFISAQFPCMHVDKEQLKKACDVRDKKRRQNLIHKKPIWQTWGTDEYNPGNAIGFFGQKQVFGNNFQGEQWVEQQKRRQKEFIFEPGEIKAIPQQNCKIIQYVYIQPSTSQEKLDYLRKIGHQFEDTDFPANEISLNGNNGPDPEWDVVQWKKLRYMIPNAIIFQGKVQPTDIKQGYLGDCYFLAGLAALAQRPDRIFNLFLLKEKNELSYFSVKILYRGKWRIIDMDDSVPFVFGTPAFSRSIEGELWVILLEKAWAKLYGSYKQIQAGFPEQPLHDLTGAPIKQIFLNNKSFKNDQEWRYLIESSLKEYAMVASSNTDTDLPISATGIFRAHAYTFLNAIQIQTREGKQRVVQLRNTWARGEFKGKWADDHPIWDQVSQEDKYRVHYVKNEDDGVFYMSYEDFIKEFRIITIAEISDNASYVYQSSYDPNKKGVYFAIKILQESNYCLQVDKTPQRYFEGQKQKSYMYPESSLEIGRIGQKSSQMMEGCSSRKKTMFKTYKLMPGDYVAYVKINFDPKYEQDFEVTLAIYSDFSCGITIASKDDVFKLTGSKSIDWDGQKKYKPITQKTAFEMRSSTCIQIHDDNRPKLVSAVQQEHVIEVEKPRQQKQYRYMTEFERKNPFVMFGLENVLIQSTPCYQEAVGELKNNWNSKEKRIDKSKSKQKQSKTIQNTTSINSNFSTTSTTNHNIISPTSINTSTNTSINTNNTTKSVHIEVHKQKTVTTQTHNTHSINKTQNSHSTTTTTQVEEVFDSRVYKITEMKKNQGHMSIHVKTEKIQEVKHVENVREVHKESHDGGSHIKVVQINYQSQRRSVSKEKRANQQKQAIENKPEDKVKQRAAPYIEGLIENVLGFTDEKKPKVYERKENQMNKSVRNLATKQKSKSKSKEKNVKQQPIKQFPKEIPKQAHKKQQQELAAQKMMYMSLKLPPRPKPSQLNIQTLHPIEQKPTPNTPLTPTSRTTDKQKQQIRESLKKRRKQKDVLRFPEEPEDRQDNILFDLWPKLLKPH